MEQHEERDGLPPGRRRWAFIAVCLTTGMAVTDSMLVNVALPTIAQALHVTPAESIWVLNAYQLAVAVTLLPMAWLGDRLGHERMNIAGATLFMITSFLCSQANSLEALALFRLLQGVGASMLMSVNPALIRFIYPKALLGRALGFNAMIVALGLASGPTITAAILSVADWHWLFAISVPLAAIAIVLGLKTLPRTQRTDHRFDIVGACLTGLCFALLIVSLDGVGHGMRIEFLLAEIVVMIGAGIILVKRELLSTAPMLPVDLFRFPVFMLSISASFVAFVGQALTLTAMPFFLQRRLGFSAVETGLLMTPWPIALGITAPIAGRLAERFSPAAMGIVGLCTAASGLLSLGLLSEDASVLDICWRMVLTGVGIGIFQTPNNRMILSSVPLQRSGGAAGMLAMARTLGQTFGSASVAVLFVRFPANVHILGPVLGACLALAGAVVSGLRLRR